MLIHVYNIIYIYNKIEIYQQDSYKFFLKGRTLKFIISF
jgi:hypothetical protein